MDLAGSIERLLGGESLANGEAMEIVSAIIEGDVAEAQIAGWLIALRAKRPTGLELAEMAHAMRDHAVAVPDPPKHMVDTCGTGGGAASFNLSTAAAFIACGAGAIVAKHGNRAVASSCGSADVLEALGARIEMSPERSAEMLHSVGFAFLFAPIHHPAMKSVGPVRRALRVRTAFNLLGPLSNPAGARRQVIGIYDPTLGPAVSEAARRLGAERVWVVHGDDGLDEVSPRVATQVWDGTSTFRIAPGDARMTPSSLDALAPGTSLEENARILKEAVSNPESPRFEAVLPSAATVLVVAGLAETLEHGADMSRASVAEGRAIAKLEDYVRESQR